MNRPEYVTPERLRHFISEAIKEDVGDGDHSTLGSVPENMQQQAQLLIKDDCVLAGVDLALEIYNYYDRDLRVDVLKKDGDVCKKGDVAFVVRGSARSILTTERLVLNCMQRMSGIATSAREVSNMVANTNTKILDTRKTTPNFRMCEKWAVYIGGATNHRYGLYDMVMLKDNHNDYAGGISQSVEATSKYLSKIGKNLEIEVETRNLDEVKEALATNKVSVIMLDNMSIDQMAEAVKLIAGRAKTEASGGIRKDTVSQIAAIGVDYISSGAVIYAAPIKDMSLKAF